ncbi:MAG TPA: glycosyltransferase family 4 protein [Burkholderiales bacterium]
MKLAIVRQRYDASGSAERFIARSLPALERAGVEVTLIAREAQGWGARRVLRIDPFRVGKAWGDRAFADGARNAWLKEGFDLVQSHEAIPGCHVYRPEGVADLSLLKETIEHPRLRAVMCPSKKVRDDLRRGFRVAPEKLHVIYSGVDLEHFHPRERERLRGAARAELGCRPRDTVFLSTGPGAAQAVEALAAARNEAFWLAVANEEVKASERVRFVGRPDDLRPQYAAADCLLLPGGYDDFPDSVLEALAMGVPAIVSARSGAAEAIEPGVNGWTCEPDDAAGLAHLLAAADAAARGAGMETAARASAERFGSDATVRQVTGLYASL